MAWGGFQNGQIPLSEMVDVVGNGRESSFMHPAAAYNFLRMQRDCLAANGRTFGTEEAYRSRATQDWYAGPNSPLPKGTAVAPPGTSKHGWGTANDLSDYEAVWGWLQANARNYGFDWTEGRLSGERWHWLYIGSLDTSNLDWASLSIKPISVEDDPDSDMGQLYILRDGNEVVIGNRLSKDGDVFLIAPGIVSYVDAGLFPILTGKIKNVPLMEVNGLELQNIADTYLGRKNS